MCQMYVLNLLKSNTLVTASVGTIFLILFGVTDKAYATDSCKTSVAEIVSVQGVIELRRANETIWRQVEMNTMLCSGDMIHARSYSNAALRLSNESMLRLDQRTTITFPQSEKDKATSLMDLLKGAIHIITRTPKPFKVRTPFQNALVDGTEFFVGVDEDSTTIIVYEGQVTARNEHGSLVLVDHEAAIAEKNQAPRKEIIVHPIDAVQWALYYPAIIDYHGNDGLQSDDSTSRLLREAADLLTVGRVDEASVVIEQALALEPNSSEAIALQAIIAVVQNDKDQALNLATQAVALDPVSSSAKLALSYVLQAHFKIEDALEIVQEAVILDSDNALLWARLAELQMSVGDLGRALNAAQQAVDLNPNLAKTQTVLGFAYLLRIDTQGAKTMFTKAILLDQADPMPRLGMGLALIREGALEAGRIELEIAASLDPANSLIRSYLGKAYFEEKRYPLASTQFELAKERDPYDPTPWFYDAIQKQTQNRPVEALKDIQKSIELNDNRAVYRSRLLLDQDQAGRGSSLARIFGNLGFEKRALMETAKSLSHDPSNYSAHRFLSDTYANIPRHEVARVSELLQAQLLQPINVNPVQPHAAVPDLNIITGTGPSAAGFNEFTPLMERNKPQLVASGVVGNQGTLGNEMVFSTLYDRTSVSLGQFHYETNGFRTNNDQKHNIYNAFIQHAFTSKFNMQVEIRTRTKEFGDLVQNFNPKNFSDVERRKLEDDTARLGVRYSFSPHQHLIASSIFVDRRISSDFGPSNRLSNVQNYQSEVQFIHKESNFNITAGGGFYRLDSKDKRNNSSLGQTIRDKKNVYMYSNWYFPKNTTTTLGLSYDSHRRESNSEDFVDLNFNVINPKIGLQWDIFQNLRLRLAWFKASRNNTLANHSIEPTQVAGFNQFFDDPNGTRTERKGIGLDFRPTNTIYSGIEASIRDLKVPFLDEENFDKQREQLYRAYLYFSFYPNWSVNGEFQFEKFDRTKKDNLPNEIQTMRLPVSINYFNPNGFYSKLSGTYINQKVEQTESVNSDFFVVDTTIGYRLPGRRGLVSIVARNLLNNNFRYRNPWFFVSDTEQPLAQFVPTRTFFARLTLNF